MKKYVIGLFLLATFIISTPFASAQSENTSNSCTNFNRDLYNQVVDWNTSTGNNAQVVTALRTDVERLHRILAERNINVVSASERSARKYGITTAEAVVVLQQQLHPTHSAIKVNGILDFPTRSALNALYGCFEKITVTLTRPNAPITIAAGSPMEIVYNIGRVPTGTSADLKISYVLVNNGEEGNVVPIATVPSVTNGNNKVYRWVVPQTIAPGAYKIQLQVVDRNNPSSDLQSDKSSQSFTILTNQVTLTVPVSPATDWKKGEDARFILNKSNTTGPVSITAVKWNTSTNAAEAGSSIILFPSLSFSGTITVPRAKTNELSVGSYKLEARTVSSGSVVVGSSAVFNVVSPSMSISVSPGDWINGAPRTFTLTKGDSIGLVKISALPQSGGGAGITLIDNFSGRGTITLPASATKLLTAGRYKLEARTKTEPILTAVSGEFTVISPTIRITTPTMWAKGNRQTLSITKDQGIGNVKVTAIPQGNTPGGSIILVSSTDKKNIAIPNAKTRMLSIGSYKIEVRGITQPDIFVLSDTFQVRAPLIAVTNVTNPWRMGVSAKVMITKDALVTGATSLTAIPLNADNTPTSAGTILLPDVNGSGEITIPANKVNLLTPGRYKIEVRTTSSGIVYEAETDPFTVLAASNSASFSSAFSAFLNKIWPRD